MADNNNINLLNEKLKAKEAAERAKNQTGTDEPMKLDDAARVKVLSPARLVAKRFFRNKLAMVGLVILIILFAFSFLGSLIYPYSQFQKFTGTNKQDREYAVSGEPSSVYKYVIDGSDVSGGKDFVDSFIIEMEKNGDGTTSQVFSLGTEKYRLTKIYENLYTLSKTAGYAGKIDHLTGTIAEGTFDDEVAAELINTWNSRAKGDKDAVITIGGIEYMLVYGSKSSGTKIYSDYPEDQIKEGLLATSLVFDKASPDAPDISDDFRISALNALAGERQFTFEGKDYKIVNESGEELIEDAAGNVQFGISKYATRDELGQDTFDIDFKKTMVGIIDKIEAEGLREYNFTYNVPQLNPETREYEYDEDGNIVLQEEDLTVKRKEVAGEIRYHVQYLKNTEVYSLYEKPSWNHWLGTDGDGYDVLARIMYGGRISLIVGFVVVILETILGVIMGGIAGFFGGWVDTLIMRLVDIFYCIPTMPIMIIIASVFDKLKMAPYQRLLWMMGVLGVLGWSGIARLVRGQILSLREQEFMTAAEATGLKTGRRIFKHLVPNVMPQLIVSMTMGLGSVILMESTLSYLGLGVKHPYATWGNIINSVSDIEAMKSYVYIWLPVGLLISLAVIAFNFVGDGLRDAFDPKMKR